MDIRSFFSAARGTYVSIIYLLLFRDFIVTDILDESIYYWDFVSHFLANQKRKKPEKSSGESDSDGEGLKQKSLAAASDDAATASTSATVSVPTDTGPTASVQTSSTAQQQNYAENDVGHFLGRSFSMSSAQKLEILKNCWVPPPSYDFGKDAVLRKRKFKHTWLAEYAPWLAYSAKLKGALCVYCVLFPPATSNTMGSFTLRPFVRYKDMHEFAKIHAASQCHKTSKTSAKNFIQNMPVDVQLVSAHVKIIQDNKKIVASVIDTVFFVVPTICH